MTVYLFDTNFVSHLVRFPDGPVSRRVRVLDDVEFCISSIVAAELRYGCEKRGSARLSLQVEQVLSGIRIEPFADAAAACYASARVQLERTGTPIGHNDLFIAAHALALGCVLVTDNVREFSRVPGLTVENWLR